VRQVDRTCVFLAHDDPAVSSSDIQFGPRCHVEPDAFHDIYDCKLDFSIIPKRGATYSIDVVTFNSDQIRAARRGGTWSSRIAYSTSSAKAEPHQADDRPRRPLL